MGLVSKPFTLSAGAVIVAAQHNSNYDTLYNLVNGNLDSTNLSASANIVDTQLLQISTAGKVSGSAITGYTGVGIVAAITFVIDGGGDTIATGVKGDLQIPFDCTINSVTLLADQSGSIIIDIWKDVFANYPPTIADTITASALPTISSATNSTDSTLTGWTKTITAGDTIRFNVNSATTITRATLILKVTRT